MKILHRSELLEADCAIFGAIAHDARATLSTMKKASWFSDWELPPHPRT
ncbi:MAG: hypothetical protein AAGE59_15530 [Cyanobacteria bacterium P01_F01_bin.86]